MVTKLCKFNIAFCLFSLSLIVSTMFLSVFLSFDYMYDGTGDVTNNADIFVRVR